MADRPEEPRALKRLASIDCLRGIAALAVVLYHALLFGRYDMVEAPWFRAVAFFLGHGYLGVPLFFVISGFCIHLRWAQRHLRDRGDTVDFVSFWKRRIHRLYPSYLAV